MKTAILSIDGKKTKEIELPTVFETEVRQDILKKVFEASKQILPYGPNPRSGKQKSASGIVRHRRHKWKSHYGRGIARLPRKIMWRRGTQFYWIGASVSGAVGGRRAHPPKVAGRINSKRINKKEVVLAVKSAIAATANKAAIKKRYASLQDKKVEAPYVVESKLTTLKVKELMQAMNKILGDLANVAIRKKSVRAGRGKLRGRKYKTSAGALIVTGKDETLKTKIIESKKINQLEVNDLYPAGRLVIFTENAIKELGEVKSK